MQLLFFFIEVVSSEEDFDTSVKLSGEHTTLTPIGNYFCGITLF